jgi:hypothetical protein
MAKKGIFGPAKDTDVKIEFTKNLLNPFVKLFPSKAEQEAGYFMVASRDPKTGEKISLGVGADGYEKFQYEPALDKDGNKIPVVVNEETGKAQPFIKDMRTVEGNCTFDDAIMSRARVDISIPNENPDSNLRKRNITVPASFLEPKKNTFVLTLKPDAYKDGIKVNVPTAPYVIGADGSKNPIQTETRDYHAKGTGTVSKKLMAPVGLDANGQPVWDDGTKAIVKEGSPKIAEFEAQQTPYATFKTAVKYDYRDDRMKLDDLKKTLEAYKDRGANEPQIQDPEIETSKAVEDTQMGA